MDDIHGRKEALHKHAGEMVHKSTNSVQMRTSKKELARAATRQGKTTTARGEL